MLDLGLPHLGLPRARAQPRGPAKSFALNKRSAINKSFAIKTRRGR